MFFGGRLGQLPLVKPASVSYLIHGPIQKTKQFAKWDKKQAQVYQTGAGKMMGMLLSSKYVDSDDDNNPDFTGPFLAECGRDVQLVEDIATSENNTHEEVQSAAQNYLAKPLAGIRNNSSSVHT